MGAIVLIGAALLVVALLVAVVVFLIRRSWTHAGAAALVAGVTVILYGLALVAVSVTTPARTLAIGEWKCFDDWCASVTSVSRTGDAVTVVLSVQNQGRREQAPDTPRVWLIRNGHREEVIVPGLNARVPGGSVRRLPTMALTAPANESPQLVVTEGGFPSRLVIGDDNSPFHPQPAWPLT
jgi:hypothetical protein